MNNKTSYAYFSVRRFNCSDIFICYNNIERVRLIYEKDIL